MKVGDFGLAKFLDAEASDLTVAGQVIGVPGGNDSIVAAMDKKTGAVKWKSSLPADVGTRGKDGAGYTGVVISTIESGYYSDHYAGARRLV